MGSYPYNQWAKLDNIWYRFDSSVWMQAGWLKDGETWYYLDGSGAMKTGWLKVSGKWYYAYSSGALAINTTTPDGYRVNYNGEWVGWFNYNKNTLYYLTVSSLHFQIV